MKRVVLAVHDRQSDLFGQPIFCATVGVGVRSFTQEVNREDVSNDLYHHSDDYVMYKIGDYDDERGMLIPCQLEQVCIASNVKVKK